MTRLLPPLLLCAAVALAACSSEPQRNAAAAAPSASASPVAEAPAAAPVATQDTGAKPKPGALNTFGDWTVGCDNALRCELRSLAPEEEGMPGAIVSIAREAGPQGKLSLAVKDSDGHALDAAVDGREGSAEQTLVAMANGHLLAARLAGKAVASVSLKGASAALRYVDAMQGRAGTVTALVAKGLKPASAVPNGLALPVIAAVKPGGTAATPSAAQLATMRKQSECDEGVGAPEDYALGGGKTLVLLPCSSGAYNLSSALFVLDGKDFAPAKADAPSGMTETAEEAEALPSVVNGRFKDGVLTSYAKGRGIGDCGVMQEFVWDGVRLRLGRQREMGECRGNVDYITTWRAQVVRR